VCEGLLVPGCPDCEKYVSLWSLCNLVGLERRLDDNCEKFGSRTNRQAACKTSAIQQGGTKTETDYELLKPEPSGRREKNKKRLRNRQPQGNK
jgi:hypothetical protein